MLPDLQSGGRDEDISGLSKDTAQAGGIGRLFRSRGGDDLACFLRTWSRNRRIKPDRIASLRARGASIGTRR